MTLNSSNIHLENIYEKMSKIILNSENDLINEAIDHVLSSGGKKIRALFPIYFGSFVGAKMDKSISLGAICEIIHNATLLHDDVIDSTQIRRNKPVFNKLWGNKNSILFGDYLFSVAIKELNVFGLQELYTLAADTIKKLALGEMLQLKHQNSLAITDEEYFKIIEYKTASLFILASTSMAIIEKADDYKIDFYNFGLHFGLIFQIKDDLNDYFMELASSGKAKFSDFKNKVTTLPLIKLFELSNNSEKKEIEALFNKEAITVSDEISILNLMKKYEIKKTIIENDLNNNQIICEEILNKLPENEFKNELQNILNQIRIF
ncbi:MAG: polyprenyl synthetase family protein [Pseudomonadota bacterium]